MIDNLDQYKHLWEKQNEGWVLLRSPNLAGGFCVFNKFNNTLLCIESSDTNTFVCYNMLANGCEIIDDIPAPIPNAQVQSGWGEEPET